MINSIVEQELHEHLKALPLVQQCQVLDFARTLATKRIHGVPGKSLLSLAGTIDAVDLATMSQAIDEGCERVNMSEW